MLIILQDADHQTLGYRNNLARIKRRLSLSQFSLLPSWRTATQAPSQGCGWKDKERPINLPEIKRCWGSGERARPAALCTGRSRCQAAQEMGDLMRRNERANNTQAPQARYRDNRSKKKIAVRRQAEGESPRVAPALAVT